MIIFLDNKRQSGQRTHQKKGYNSCNSQRSDSKLYQALAKKLREQCEDISSIIQTLDFALADNTTIDQALKISVQVLLIVLFLIVHV